MSGRLTRAPVAMTSFLKARVPPPARVSVLAATLIASTLVAVRNLMPGEMDH